ncbi:MAG: choice-of-anchor tandem repeat GloVer-containing protein [Terriglobales bacterium]
MVLTIFAFCVGAAAIASPAKTAFTSLVSFDGTNGSNTYYESLVQGTDGNLYGTTTYGGANEQNCYGESCGTVFKITPAGTLTTLHKFGFADGGLPEAGLAQTIDGNFYGTAAVGGSSGFGTIFKITPAGRLTTVYEFQNSTDGGNPLGALVRAHNGIFYGTTSYGGGNPCACGTVFKVTSEGTLTTLHTFVGGGTEGNYPEAGLVQGADGNFYGTTAAGGANGYGTVFKITPAGTLTTLHNFDGTDGANPWAGLLQGTDGKLYGTTTYGGTSGSGCGGFGCGTVFKITRAGTLTTLHNFDGTDGGNPLGGLAQATNGTFYGTTSAGSTDNHGTVFSLSIGLGPFAETLPTSGKVEAKVIILGNNLTDTTSVTFNGISATFTVIRSTEITTTVPAGATTGKVDVTTPKGTLKSNVVFRVTR